MTSSLNGRTALVTGAGRGIGRRIALGLAQSGARVGLLARTAHEIDDACAEIHDAGGSAVALAADVSDPEQTRIAVQRLVDEFGHVELLVNNAAVVWPLGPTQDVDPAAVAAAIAINVIGPMTLTRRVLPAMLDAGWGRIVNVSAAIAARPGMLTGLNTYAASKGALEAHTLNLAAELEGTGVTANVYRPGTVDTSMQAYIRDQPREQIGAPLHDRFTTMLPLRRADHTTRIRRQHDRPPRRTGFGRDLGRQRRRSRAMTTDGQPLPTARLARGGDFTPDPALHPFASRWLASSAGAMHYSDEDSGPAILFCHGNPHRALSTAELSSGSAGDFDASRLRCTASVSQSDRRQRRSPVSQSDRRPALAGAASCAVSQPVLNAAGVIKPVLNAAGVIIRCARCGRQRL